MVNYSMFIDKKVRIRLSGRNIKGILEEIEGNWIRINEKNNMILIPISAIKFLEKID